MQIRLIFIVIFLALLGVFFFTNNQLSNLSNIENALFISTVAAGTITVLSIAIASLFSTGFLLAARAASIPLLITALVSDARLGIKISISLLCVALLSLFFENILSKLTFDTGAERENVFILKTPRSIFVWISFGFVVAWSSLIQGLNLILKEEVLLGAILLFICVLTSAVFTPYCLRVLLRRCVIVPHGIVISDQITLTDVVLLPLAKINTIEHLEKITLQDIDRESTVTSLTSNRNVVKISLNEKTDSLILRKGVNESERINADTIYLSIARPKYFVNFFHLRFHKVQPENLTKSQEKIIEKQLGILTAPRSDAPLPSHRSGPRSRKNKKSTSNDS